MESDPPKEQAEKIPGGDNPEEIPLPPTAPQRTRMERRILEHCKHLFLGHRATRNPNTFYAKHKGNMYLQTEDGESIGALFLPPAEFNEHTQYYIVCHGKGCDRRIAQVLLPLDGVAVSYNVCFLVIDYRGFADSTGEYTIEGVNLDVLAAYKYFKEHYGNVPVSIVGHSLGTAVALEYGRYSLARGSDIPERIFLMAPFSSTIEICMDFKRLFSVFSFFIPSLPQLIREGFNYDNVSSSKKLGDRIYIFHGLNDKLISVEHPKRIVDACGAVYKETTHTHVNIFGDEAIWAEIFEINRRG